jgi:hypothetical protein
MFIYKSCIIMISVQSFTKQACYIEISFGQVSMWSSTRGPCVQAPRLLPKLMIRYCHGCALLPSSHSSRVVSILEPPTLRIVSSSIHLEPIAIAAASSAALRFGRTFFSHFLLVQLHKGSLSCSRWALPSQALSTTHLECPILAAPCPQPLAKIFAAPASQIPAIVNSD